MKIVRVTLIGLFGTIDHEVNFRKDEPTIVLGPNGAGKTHVLRLTAAVLSLDYSTLLNTAYRELSVRFEDSRELRVTRSVDEGGSPSVSIRSIPEDASSTALIVTLDELESVGRNLPPEVRQVGPNRWLDERRGTEYNASMLERRFGKSVDPLAAKLTDHPSISELCGPPKPVFIDTWRLDSRADDSLAGSWGRAPARSSSNAASRIRSYTERLREEIAEARRASVRATQSADLSFAARALQAASLSVNEKSLHSRYDETVRRHEALARNGLAVGEAPISFPESTTPTVRRILNVFLDDWDQRLEPLLPVNEKLQVLREILDSKLAPSGKRTSISAQGGLEFYNASGQRLLVSRLSSGEQHLVALFTLLLFAAKRNSLVLIDEPEISLHAAWKHAFLEDISRVADTNGLQVILATHSAGIVNGRWDLVEELSLNTDSVLDIDIDSVLDDEDDLDD
ncbi:MAG: AAA family ATPase [Lacipirellulaceae bacterium]